MFFLFGWGRQTIKNHGTVGAISCGNCGNRADWDLITATTWFTLFFIPVIPYDTKHYCLCPICQKGVLLDGQKFKELKDTLNGIGATQQASNHLKATSPNSMPPSLRNDVAPISKAAAGQCNNCGTHCSVQSGFCKECGARLGQ